MTYGFHAFPAKPFALKDASPDQNEGFEQSVEQFNFLEKNIGAAVVPIGGLQLVSSTGGLGDLYVDANALAGGWATLREPFGERMDPFSG